MHQLKIEDYRIKIIDKHHCLKKYDIDLKDTKTLKYYTIRDCNIFDYSVHTFKPVYIHKLHYYEDGFEKAKQFLFMILCAAAFPYNTNTYEITELYRQKKHDPYRILFSDKNLIRNNVIFEKKYIQDKTYEYIVAVNTFENYCNSQYKEGVIFQ